MCDNGHYSCLFAVIIPISSSNSISIWGGSDSCNIISISRISSSRSSSSSNVFSLIYISIAIIIVHNTCIVKVIN